MKKNYILFLIAILSFGVANAQGACSQNNDAPVTNIIYTNPERGNQMVAFDLAVDAYTEFTLTTVTVKMATANMAALNPTGIVSVYSNSGTDLPDAVVATETIAPTVVTDAPISTFAIYTVTFDFATPVVLDNLMGDTEAKYWVAFNMGNTVNGDTGVTGGDLVAGLPYAVISDNTGGAWELSAGAPLLDGTYTFEGTCLLSVDEFEMSQIAVTPNPTTEFINIDMPNNSGSFVSELYDITGKQVLRKENLETLNVSQLNSGVYILRIKTDNAVVSRRIIKE